MLPDTGVAVWYDNALVAILQDPTVEKLEKAMEDHKVLESAKVTESFIFSVTEQSWIDVTMEFEDEEGDKITETVELTCTTIY